MNNMTVVLSTQGNVEAEEMVKVHPDMLARMNNLTRTEKMHREILALRETLGRADTPSMNSLACVLSYQGNYGEAEKMLRKALAA